MSRKRFVFKSLYAKLATVFLGLWWGLNLMILGVMLAVITPERLQRLYPVVKEIGGEFYNFKLYTLLAIAASVLIGSAVILMIVRGIVKPVAMLSNAARKVAAGDFDVAVNAAGADELSLLTQDFNRMTAALKSMDAMRGQFVSSVSHEFRTPITSIKGYAELLREDAAHIQALSDEKKLQYCNVITEESTRLMALSGDLLRLSDIDSKAIRRITAFSLDEQIRKVVLLLEPQWSKKNIAFDLELEDIKYSGDRDLMEQLWINLIQNAIKFSYDDGVVAVRLQKLQSGVCAQIADQGIGIAPADLAHIFDSFYMAKASRENGGNGLGLAIVKRIIEISGGRIDVKSELGMGTVFEMELPSV